MRVVVAAVALLSAKCAFALAATVDGARFTVTLDADASTHSVAWDDRARVNLQFNLSTTSGRQEHDIFLAIGVKTSVLHGAAARQAIRQTWGQPEQLGALGVRIWFVGCTPDLSDLPEADRASAVETIDVEKAIHQDLLTHEVRCEDSFAGRVGKTIEFMHFVESSSSSPTTPAFVMMATDDVYIRLGELIQLLQSAQLPRERLYAGNAATPEERGTSPPVRDPHSRFYLPVDMYPMSELPPFVAGAHYLVSRDMAQFVARNRDDLRGFGGLDDVTMALWMLCLQVHPVFLDSFQVLGNAPCSEDIISFANLSPTAMHQIESNLVAGLSFCHNYSDTTWQTDAFLGETGATQHRQLDEQLKFRWDVQHDPVSMSLHIQVDIVVGDKRAGLVYVPSAGPYDAVFCTQLLELVRAEFGAPVDSSFCSRHRRSLQNFLDQEQRPSLRAKFAIARHNLARAEADAVSGVPSPTVTIVLSPMALYSRVVLECLMIQIYKDHHVAVVSEADVSPDAPPPAIFVFSILDEGRRTDGEASNPHALGSGAAFVYKYGPTSRLLMVAGEAWPTFKLHPHVTLLSTVETPRHPKFLYLPYASATFGEIIRHDPTQLLQPTPATSERPSRFCAYLYSNCGVVIRERMFDLVNAIAPVDALGRCRGSQRAPDDKYLPDRYAYFYSDRAVDFYRGFKFVIAFENTFETPGYVTEKIVTAFLAGAVPIYYGDSATVTRLFNPRAFIDCGSFASLEACVDHVKRAHLTPSEYEAMRQEPPISNRTAFLEFFSWHPTVTDMVEASAGQVVPLSEQLKRTLLG